MTREPEALRLADDLDDEFTQGRISNHNGRKAAAELRRLHAECNDLAHQLNESNERNGRIIAQRDALLDALHSISLAAQDSGSTREGMGLYARAAIAKCEEQT